MEWLKEIERINKKPPQHGCEGCTTVRKLIAAVRLAENLLDSIETTLVEFDDQPDVAFQAAGETLQRGLCRLRSGDVEGE